MRQGEGGPGGFTTIGISFPVQCPLSLQCTRLCSVLFQPAIFPGAYWHCYAREPLKSATIFLCGISFPGQCMSNETSIKEIPSQCIALFSLNVHLILKAKSILPCETSLTQQFCFAFRFSRLYQDIKVLTDSATEILK